MAGFFRAQRDFRLEEREVPMGVAIDRAGNAWVANDDYTVTEFSNNGTLLSGSTGYPFGGSNRFRGCDRRERQCVVQHVR